MFSFQFTLQQNKILKTSKETKYITKFGGNKQVWQQMDTNSWDMFYASPINTVDQIEG